MKKETEIRYGIHPSPFGKYLLAIRGSEVCALAFLGKGGEKEALRDLKNDLQGAVVVHDQKHMEPFAKKIFVPLKKQTSVPVVLHGTDFQIKVWDALCTIPSGTTMTYAEVAKKIGSPKSARAVGTACGQNTIAYLVPCHRVLPKSAGNGAYRWRAVRKKSLLAWEAAQA